jgi:16S rRNA G1207 methylase RsmC
MLCGPGIDRYNGSMIDLDLLVNKTVPFKFRGAELKLDLSHALFSSYEVDAGTRLLLKAVGRDEVLLKARHVLDAGCGVGVIGLSIAAALPDCRVDARDRDLLACAFTERNRKRNKVPNLVVGPGLLSVSLPALAPDPAEGYDYILTNIPAKAGGPVLEAFFRGAPALLAPEGRLAVVIVKPLVDSARAWLTQYGYSLLAEERGANHYAFVALPPPGLDENASAATPTASLAPQPVAGSRTSEAPLAEPGAKATALDFSGLDLGVYLRTRGRFKLAEASYEASGIWGLAEFDTVGFASAAAAELAERALAGSLVRDALVINPGIGHLAIWAARRVGAARVVGASRDLLSLAATGANLASLGRSRPDYRAVDALRLEDLPASSFDLIFCSPDLVPDYDWIAPLWADASRLLKKGATLIVASTPTELLRFEKRRAPGYRKAGEKRKKTFLASAWCLS